MGWSFFQKPHLLIRGLQRKKKRKKKEKHLAGFISDMITLSEDWLPLPDWLLLGALTGRQAEEMMGRWEVRVG